MLAGRVSVNGSVVTELGVRIDPDRDAVTVDGERVVTAVGRWIVLHKPPGVLTTRSDPHGGATIYDVLPAEFGSLRYIGRLDRDAEGLLLLTNEGSLAHALQHPSGEVEREYWIEVSGRVNRPTLRSLTDGVELEDGPARAVRVQLLEVGEVASQLTVVLAEGRKREVRRMMAAMGHSVMRLRRTRFGPISLGSLGRGEWRDLEASELAALRRLAGESAAS